MLSLNNISLYKDLKDVVIIKNTKKVLTIGKCREFPFLVGRASYDSHSEVSCSWFH